MTAPFSLSVLIDTYQQQRFVARAVESALAQTLPATEVVVIDDGSTDNTDQELAQFGSRVRVIAQRNGGQAAALNAGLAALTGSWVAFLDGDDSWEPRHLERVAAAVQGDSDCDAVFAPLLRVDAFDVAIAPEPPDATLMQLRSALADPAAARQGRLAWLPPTSGIACRLECLRGAGPIPVEYRIAADGWIQVVLALRAREILLLRDRTVRLRVHGENRWTGRAEFDIGLLEARRDLYGRLATAAASLAAADGTDAAGLVRALRAQAQEFAVWERIVRGERAEAFRLARQWSPSPAVASSFHRAFRRAHLLLATLIPTPLYLGLRGAWRPRQRP